MGLDIGSLAANTATVEVEFLGQSAMVTYKPMSLTAAALEEMDITKPGESPSDGFFKFLAETITEWDLLISPKKKVPLTIVGVKMVPLPLLRAIFHSLMTEAASGEAGKGSSGG